MHVSARGAAWPEELRHVEAPPAGLWARGRLELLGVVPRVAIVGTRAPTPYGEEQAARFADAFAAAGCAVVSGLARGIDARAHSAALAAGGTTLALLGCGVDRPWPAGPLTERMLARGLLLSEYPPGTPPRRHHFPLRNRLIAGLARAVVVVEAAQASGSLITARWAADSGREVFALPGRVDQPMARGCHRLLRAGARLVEDPAEVLAELGLGPSAALDDDAPAVPDSPLLRALRGDVARAEELAGRLGRPLPEVLVELVGLEVRGAVARAPGGLWRAVTFRAREPF